MLYCTVDEKFEIPGVCRKSTTIIGCWAGVSPTSVFAGTKCTHPTPGFENFSSTVLPEIRQLMTLNAMMGNYLWA